MLLRQRSGEVAAMRWQDIQDNWWTLPGSADATWPGTKNKQTHRIWLPEPAQSILALLGKEESGYVFGGNTPPRLTVVMRGIVSQLGYPAGSVRPHDLRRAHASTITALGFGLDAMNRVLNHKEGGISSVYDRHHYSAENKRVMEAVASHLLALATGQRAASNVIRLS